MEKLREREKKIKTHPFSNEDPISEARCLITPLTPRAEIYPRLDSLTRKLEAKKRPDRLPSNALVETSCPMSSVPISLKSTKFVQVPGASPVGGGHILGSLLIL